MKKIIEKLGKQNVIKYLIILGITIILCQGFMQMHYSSDTYVLADLGYMNYPQEYFLLDGRLISAIVCFGAGILNIPLETYIVGMNIIGVIFVASTIYLMSKILTKIFKPQKIVNEIIIIGVAFITILNQFTLEYLLFPESAVMCLGLFLIIVAVNIWRKDTKFKYLKIFITLLIATICYQGLLNIFPILIVLIGIVNHILKQENKKIEFKKIAIDLLKIGLILIVVLGISVATIEIGKAIFDSQSDRTNDISTEQGFITQIVLIWLYLVELWNKTLNMLPHYINYITIGTTIIMLIVLKVKKRIIAEYILFILLILITCIVPMFVFNTGPVGRVNSPIGMLIGMSLILLYTATINCKKEKVKNMVYGIIIIFFILNSMYIIRNISEHIASNNVEENMGATIRHSIEQYEAQTGIEVTKFGYIYDKIPQQYAYGIEHMGSMTEKKFGCPWSIFEVMNYYTERKFERVYVQESLTIDYEEFTYEQILFDNDTVYLVIY